MERALVIGRFQPFHKGHESIIAQMAANPQVGEILIGIGSAQYSNSLNNPFNYKERTQMITSSLRLEKPYQIIAIPDVHNNLKWMSLVEKLCPEFNIIYTGNPLLKQLFGDRGYLVVESPYTYSISATQIRDLMVRGGNWQALVPEGTRQTLEKLKAVRRLLKLENSQNRKDCHRNHIFR